MAKGDTNDYQLKWIIHIVEKQIEMSWEYAKQENDLRCRMYLQYFAVSLSAGITILIAIFTGVLNIWFILISIICFLSVFFLIDRLRHITKDLKNDWDFLYESLEDLKDIEWD